METEKTQKTARKTRQIVIISIVSILLTAFGYFIVLKVEEAHEAAFNSSCSSYMAGLASMLRDYQGSHGHLPPPVTYNEEGQAMHSWRTIILGFRVPEFVDGYDFSLPWDSPANLEFARNNVPNLVQYPVGAHGTAPNFMLAIGCHSCEIVPGNSKYKDVLSSTGYYEGPATLNATTTEKPGRQIQPRIEFWATWWFLWGLELVYLGQGKLISLSE